MIKKTAIHIIFAFFMAGLNAQVYDTANVTPGTLYTVAYAYLNTVTNLTVTGTIDARDFKTMRDSMPVLAVLNLTDATIAAYTGTAGTQDANSDTYAANEIPQRAFCNKLTGGKTSLTSITFPTNITSIEGEAFTGCTGLTGSLNIPSSITYIGEGAFAGCTGLTGTLNIPSSINSIGAGVFSDCSGLTGSLTIPSSVTSIGWEAFYDCSGLTGLIIPSSVTYIGESAFFGCSGLTGSLIIPSSVTYIGEQAFQWCSRLTGSLTIPSSVTYIGNSAFWGCYRFTGSLTIPSSVTYIGVQAFSGCSGLRNIVTSNPVPLTGQAIGSGVFDWDSIKFLIVPCGSINTYKSANQWNSFNITASDKIFAISSSGDTLKPGSSVIYSTHVSCFSTTPTLQWKVNEKNVGTGDTIFSYIPAVGDSIKCIASFKDTTVTSNIIVMHLTGRLAKVIIPGTLNTVAKAYLSTVTNLKIDGTIDARDFKTMRDSMPNLAVLNLSNVTIAAYTGTAGTFKEYYDTIYNLNEIPLYAFRIYGYGGKTSLTSITYPTNVNSIGDYAFSNCSGLTGSLIIPSSVTYIGKGAFTNCYSFTSLSIPSSITYIEDWTFDGCEGFKGSLTIPSSVTYIGGGAFYNCPGLTGSLIIPSSVTSIERDAFYGCGFTGSLTIPSSITYIGDYAFFASGFTSIVDLNPTPLTGNVGSSAFYEDNINNLYVPYSSVSPYKAAPPWNGFNILPIVQVSTKNDTVATGTTITYTATGSINKPASLQWFVNGKKVGLDSTIYSYIPLNGDSISCKAIIDNDTIISNSFVMNVVPASLLVSTNNLNVSYSSNSQATFTINSNIGWNISSKYNWLTPNVTSGTDISSIILTASANNTINPRVDTITVSGTGVPNDTVFVTQASGHATLSVSKDTLDISAFANNHISFKVYSNETWTLTNSKTQTWLTPGITSGTDTTIITLSAADNTSTNQRIDTILVFANGVKSDTIFITQAAGAPKLSVSSNTFIVNASENNSAQFKITSNINWTINEKHNWLVPNINSGNDTSEIILTASANPDAKIRTDTIVVSGTGVGSQIIIVTQEAAPATLSVSSNTFIVNASENNSAQFKIISNINWTINEKYNWLVPNINSGNDTAEIILTASSNPDGLPRTDTVFVSGTGVDPQIIVVIQDANPGTNVMTIENSEVKLYPVPVINMLNVSLPFTPNNTNILIYNVNGVEIYSTNVTDSITEIDMSNLSPGIYFIKINTSDNSILIRKILKL